MNRPCKDCRLFVMSQKVGWVCNSGCDTLAGVDSCESFMMRADKPAQPSNVKKNEIYIDSELTPERSDTIIMFLLYNGYTFGATNKSGHWSIRGSR